MAVSVITLAALTSMFLQNMAKCGRKNVRPRPLSGKIFLTVRMSRRRHGQARERTGPQTGGAGPGALPEPASRAGARPGLPGQRVLRRPRPGAGQIRDGAAGRKRRAARAPGGRAGRVRPPPPPHWRARPAGPRATAREAGKHRAPGGGLDARYEQLRHAALHARAEASPLGLGVLTGKGVTAGRHALAGLTPAGGQGPGASTAAPACQPPGIRPAQGARLPAPVAAELIHVLAAVALAAAATSGPSPSTAVPTGV